MILVTNYLIYIVAIMSLAFIFLRYRNKNISFFDFLSIKRMFLMVLPIFTTVILVKIIKLMIAEPRPFEVLLGVNKLLTATQGESFPSNHAAFAAVIACIVYFHNKKLGKILILFSFLVGVSRIYVGVHYPLDVLVGWGIGFVIAYIFYKIIYKNVKVFNK